MKADKAAYSGSFVAYWVGRFIYCEAGRGYSWSAIPRSVLWCCDVSVLRPKVVKAAGLMACIGEALVLRPNLQRLADPDADAVTVIRILQSKHDQADGVTFHATVTEVSPTRRAG